MKSGVWPTPWFSIPVLLFFNIGLLLQLYLPTGYEILYLNPWRSEPANLLFRSFTQLGEAPAFVVLGLVLMLWRYRIAVLFILAGIILIPTSYVLKELIRKDRPITYFQKNGLSDAVEIDPEIYLNRGKTSFPSGHTMAAFGMYGLLALFADRKRPWIGLLLALTAILVAFSRVYLVQHFLSDILGGALIGLTIVAMIGWLNRHFLQRYSGLDKGMLSKFRQERTIGN